MISSPGSVRTLAAFGVLALCLSLSPRAAESGPAADEILTFSELLAKAETIFVAELGDADLAGVHLKVLDVLKAPPDEVTRDWRAQAILRSEAERPRPKEGDPKTKALHGTTQVESDPLPPVAVIAAEQRTLPAKGTQGVFFLWNRQKGTDAVPLRYRIEHPQNVYDIQYAAEVKLELNRSRSAERRAYLRPWDEQMARKATVKKAEIELQKVEPGKIDRGLSLTAVRVRRSIRNDNTFDITVRFENGRGYPQAVYDGLISGFGVLIRKKGAAREDAVVLRVKEKNLTQEMDPAVLAVVDATDFAVVAASGTLSKELHFDVRDHGILKDLEGTYLVEAFYRNDHEGKGLENLPAAPWTGVLVSTDLELELGRPTAAAAP